MKLTKEIIADLELALDMRKKNGDVIWEDGDDIEALSYTHLTLPTILLV